MVNSTKILIIILALFSFIISINSASAILLTDLGVDAQNVSSGALLTTGDLNIQIWDNATGGNMIYNYTFVSAITNGSWNVVIDPTIEYGKFYWKDYAINGEDLDYNGEERIEFQSYAGIINNASFMNFSLISPCAAGEAIQQVYENGSVLCATITSSGSGGWTNDSVTTSTDLNVNVTGNITTLNYGFFGYLGSLASRITQLFVQDVDVSNNIVAAGNVTATYFLGNGSLLTDIASAAETDPKAYNGTLAYNSSLANYYLASNPSNFIDAESIGNSTIARTGACPSGQFVQNTTTSGVQCTTPATASETDPFWTGNASRVSALEASNITTNSRIDSVNSSKLDATDQRYNDTVLANTKALPGTCAAGKVVQNTTTSGVQCVDLSVTESDPLWTSNQSSYSTTAQILAFSYYNASDFDISDYFTSAQVLGFNYYNSTTLSESDPLFTAENTSIYSSINAKLDATDQRYNDTVLANAKALPGTCSGTQVVQNTTTSGVQCVTPTVTETDPKYVADNGTIARTGTCGAGTYASATTTTGVTCSTPPGASDSHTHDALNLTNLAGLNNKITLDAANITAGTFAFTRLPTLTDTHTHTIGAI